MLRVVARLVGLDLAHMLHIVAMVAVVRLAHCVHSGRCSWRLVTVLVVVPLPEYYLFKWLVHLIDFGAAGGNTRY